MTNDMRVNDLPVFSWRQMANGTFEIVCSESQHHQFSVGDTARFRYCDTVFDGSIGRVIIRTEVAMPEVLKNAEIRERVSALLTNGRVTATNGELIHCDPHSV